MRLTLTSRKTSIDLLPESVQKPKRYRKLLIRLAAAQVAIFIILAAAIIALNVLDSQAQADSQQWAQRINTLRHGPEVAAAAYARDIYRRLAAEEAFFYANLPADFDPVWIAAILEADQGHMTALDYNGGFILLTGIAEEMSTIESHRQSLLGTEIFEYVGHGRIVLQEDGRFFYELRIGVR